MGIYPADPRLADEIDRSVREFVAAAQHLSERRAALLHRGQTIDDAWYAFMLLCKWPWKPPPAEPETTSAVARWLVAGAIESASRLDEAVPDDVLTWTPDQLVEAQGQGPHAFLSLPPE